MTPVSVETEKAGAWSSLAVLLTGNFLTILDLFIVNIALPDIQRRLHASNAELQLIMVAYSLTYGALLLNGARLGDLYGRRKLFLVGMAIFALGSLLCALAFSPWSLISARAVQGIGAALLMPQVYASLRVLFEGEGRRKAFSVMGAVQGIAGAASQVVGGYLLVLNIGDIGWRLVFLVNLPVACYALIAGKWMIVETRAVASTTLDLWGAVLGTSALTLILLPVMVGQDYHWPWWAIIAPLLSLPVFMCFVSYEARLARRGGIPIIDISLFKKKSFVLGVFAAFLFFSAIGSFSLSLTILLQVGLEQTALEAGTFFVPSTVAFFIGSLLSGLLAKQGEYWTLFFGMFVFAAGLLTAVLSELAGGHYILALSASVVLQGLGQGIVVPLLLNMILSTVSSKEAGMASGAFSTMQIAGSAFGVTIVGTILFNVLEHVGGTTVSTHLAENAYGEAFSIASIYNLVAVILGLAIFIRLQMSRQQHPYDSPQ
ncbi:MFS transporter [Rhizobium lusitanum]|uniref:Major Facilitator Superfamily protein n=1 Tax=Rhizobium lusitanum TaxID=293958 RepID=A0A1C3WXF8_9HYPH|nr:MFS transporter [Rhizobium lusitanum]SCB44702.1 Major Facilitator Superfamily protein [Rhizobium lusitanum]